MAFFAGSGSPGPAFTLSRVITMSKQIIVKSTVDGFRRAGIGFNRDGVVLTVRPVVVDGSQSGVGAAVGGVVGAVGGYGGSGVKREAQILGVLASVAGAAVGNTIERMSTREDALEILVQLKSGDRRAIVQATGGETFNPGDAVIIVTTGSKVRITKAPVIAKQ